MPVVQPRDNPKGQRWCCGDPCPDTANCVRGIMTVISFTLHFWAVYFTLFAHNVGPVNSHTFARAITTYFIPLETLLQVFAHLGCWVLEKISILHNKQCTGPVSVSPWAKWEKSSQKQITVKIKRLNTESCAKRIKSSQCSSTGGHGGKEGLAQGHCEGNTSWDWPEKHFIKKAQNRHQSLLQICFLSSSSAGCCLEIFLRAVQGSGNWPGIVFYPHVSQPQSHAALIQSLLQIARFSQGQTENK